MIIIEQCQQDTRVNCGKVVSTVKQELFYILYRGNILAYMMVSLNIGWKRQRTTGVEKRRNELTLGHLYLNMLVYRNAS